VRRGDIIVFLKPGYPDMFLVKRVIGVPGDHIHLHEGYVYLNGKRQDEPQAGHPDYGNYSPYRDEFPDVPTSVGQDVEPTWANDLPSHIQNGDLVVPPGNYFAMGDNRLNSLDGRYWGFVPREYRRPAALRLLVFHHTGRGRRPHRHGRSRAAIRTRAAALLRPDTLAQDPPPGALKHFSCCGGER
jgi:signal peptidase I